MNGERDLDWEIPGHPKQGTRKIQVGGCKPLVVQLMDSNEKIESDSTKDSNSCHFIHSSSVAKATTLPPCF